MLWELQVLEDGTIVHQQPVPAMWGRREVDNPRFSYHQTKLPQHFHTHNYRWKDGLVDLDGRPVVVNDDTIAIGGQLPPDRFWTLADLSHHAIMLAAGLPDVGPIIGVARSGLIPASILAAHLHRPLWSVSPNGTLADLGGGGRFNGFEDDPSLPLLLIDDSIVDGCPQMTHSESFVKALFPDRKILRATIYATPGRVLDLDYTAHVLPLPHYFEWNFANSNMAREWAWDVDGVLFYDREDRPEGAVQPAPLYLPRRNVIPLVLTGRRIAHRDATVAQLAAAGVRWAALAMWPGDEPVEFRAEETIVWKATTLAASDCYAMVESHPAGAKRIADLSRKPVLCPAAKRMFRP